ncbi:polyketide cyclase [Flavobacterium sp. WLB]|uniref:SRPBCC domain-containing protein n=1 Tax=unclassified Flavobacterium TaxID=196869 RepID=UPI0006ABE095|nr:MULTISPECIES: SRPBCC domain-containing protein [unclassified Flavobacterium]KOP39346.1 polyketide cyclase [Flavobacterium sp. VMW]OWU91622.1 polyketide cyclase [Flavobacterium sp. NLM]PUU68188.1 polyketide cyclase [Flavobacterium sp. WLB]
MESKNNIQNRILQSKILLKAPTDIVWEMWTNPEHISNWWGPNGFTNTIHKMDFKEEGEWNLTMHGPDGKNYPNRSIFKEIISLRKIVFEHFNPHFITTVLFESNNSETLLDWTLLFDSEEMFDIIVKAHKADQGQKENIEKLEKYLSEFIS